MSERPILFSTPMVQAILDGCKTMTRRVVKANSIPLGIKDVRPLCPYGQVGDRLWVKETFWLPPYEGLPIFKAGLEGEQLNDILEDEAFNRWKPSIFMPRWASRITLEITDIKVERVKDICLADIQAEGIYDDKRTHNAQLQIGKFKALWDSINSKRGYSWESNPWVWVIKFMREVGQ